MADFLYHLHNDRNLAYSTIAGYRTALVAPLRAESGLEVGSDRHLSDLLENFARSQAKTKHPVPEWDLGLVMTILRKPPFEPIRKIDLKHLTLKTVFLLTLASGNRRSEIHALVREGLLREENWKSVTLFPGLDFVAKTEVVGRGSDVVKPLEITSLGDFLGGPNMEEDMKLCPVRSLKEYLKRTDKFRRERKLLFVSIQEGRDKEISRATISRWLKETIVTCYNLAGRVDIDFYNVKAHQVRAMATSWAFHTNVSIEKILMAGSWKTPNTFVSFYLRNLARKRDDDERWQVGPIVVAQQVVQVLICLSISSHSNA